MSLYVRPRGEVILALPEPAQPVGQVRSAFVLGSIGKMREHGQYDAYASALAEEHRARVLSAIPGTWLPVEAAVAHYRACEQLGLSAAEAAGRGRAALERLGGLVYGTALQMARQAGANPWTFLPSLQRFWNRAYEGGAIAVYKVGPKDARVDLLACALCEIPYYRHALGGLLEGLLTPFTGTLYVREGRQPAGPESASYRVQWT